MKYTLLYLTLVCFSFGCDDAYKEEKCFHVIQVYGEFGEVDSITLHKDTIRVYRSKKIDNVMYSPDTAAMLLPYKAIK